MLIPATAELPEIVVGGTWEISIQLFENEAHTIPFNLTGWTCTLDIKNYKELTSGAGLTITVATGLIVPVLTAAETASITTGKELRYWLKIEKAGNVLYPLRGGISLLEP
jgi:hypothetical protein